MIQYGNKMLEVEENLLKWAKSQIPDLEDMTPLREQASSRQYTRITIGNDSTACFSCFRSLDCRQVGIRVFRW